MIEPPLSMWFVPWLTAGPVFSASRCSLVGTAEYTEEDQPHRLR